MIGDQPHNLFGGNGDDDRVERRVVAIFKSASPGAATAAAGQELYDLVLQHADLDALLSEAGAAADGLLPTDDVCSALMLRRRERFSQAEFRQLFGLGA